MFTKRHEKLTAFAIEDGLRQRQPSATGISQESIVNTVEATENKAEETILL